MKKSYLLAALLSLATSLTATAEDGKLNVLYLDGQSHEVLMSKVAKLEVSGENIVLVGKDGGTVATHKVADIDKIDLTASTTAIGKLTAGGSIRVKTDGYAITAEGMADGTQLEVFTSDGKLAGKATARGGKATIDAAALGNGVYVVKAGGQSLKMVKK